MIHLLRKQSLYNQSPLKISTFDGSNSPYHPSVLFFDTPLYGYSYWMACTPYPHQTAPYRDRYECPSVYVSNDGLHWNEPEGLTNPIDNLTEDEIKEYDYLSDPHLLVRGDAIECWYMKTKRHGKSSYSSYSQHYLLRKTSNDGVNWSKEEVLMDITNVYGREMVSPATLYEGIYKMWIVDLETRADCNSIKFLSSEDGVNWTGIKPCKLNGCKIVPWHIDVQHFDGYYWLTCYEKHKALTLWRSCDGIQFEYMCELLSPSQVTASFYSQMLYRASLVKVADKDYRLYFSAEDDFSSHIGVMCGESPTSMQVFSVDGGEHRRIGKLTDVIKLYLKGKTASLIFRLKLKISQL